jgi:hypothetical protein
MAHALAENFGGEAHLGDDDIDVGAARSRRRLPASPRARP